MNRRVVVRIFGLTLEGWHERTWSDRDGQDWAHITLRTATTLHGTRPASTMLDVVPDVVEHVDNWPSAVVQ